ncbi:protein of unknown function [Candidatus Hydrogenisulfobacillus filiaventi]|uniref:Uncharacterized protein n=1 Tax=Candidatus Hydrogenisulfobacillus filiaventi TaxID=2707344 RepID=A0A6F8ZIF4_9FIRM|nr:protein of unknown function [Candidatus Hydrogenisulfobacillus filiaventi]
MGLWPLFVKQETNSANEAGTPPALHLLFVNPLRLARADPSGGMHSASRRDQWFRQYRATVLPDCIRAAQFRGGGRQRPDRR